MISRPFKINNNGIEYICTPDYNYHRYMRHIGNKAEIIEIYNDKSLKEHFLNIMVVDTKNFPYEGIRIMSV